MPAPKGVGLQYDSPPRPWAASKLQGAFPEAADAHASWRRPAALSCDVREWLDLSSMGFVYPADRHHRLLHQLISVSQSAMALPFVYID